MSNSKFKFTLNLHGLNELRNSEELIELMKEKANTGITSVASLEDYEIDSHHGAKRANVGISAKTEKGNKDNFDNNILLKALGSSNG